MKGHEVEAKYYLNDLPGFTARLEAAGARQSKARVHEVNLRYDTPGGSLTASHRVLRLRKDSRARLTYKDAALAGQEVAVRREIEIEVSSFDAAHELLEALGYRVSVAYEKYRTTYHLGEAEVSLDEMPYGNFCEIEAPDAEAIRTASVELGLSWEARCAESYLALFETVIASRGIPARHLTFSELADYTFAPADFGLLAADAC